MAHLARVKVNWTGIPSGPGFTNLYFRNTTPGIINQTVVNQAVSKTDTWLSTFTTGINNTISFVVDPTVDVIDDTNGALQGFFAATPTATRVGTQTANYSAASGVCINWSTNAVRNARRMRGRTFIVPLGNNCYAPDGTLDTTRLGNFRADAATFRTPGTDAALVIWGRPTGPAATDGVSAEVTSSSVSDKVAVLTSRRD